MNQKQQVAAHCKNLLNEFDALQELFSELMDSDNSLLIFYQYVGERGAGDEAEPTHGGVLMAGDIRACMNTVVQAFKRSPVLAAMFVISIGKLMDCPHCQARIDEGMSRLSSLLSEGGAIDEASEDRTLNDSEQKFVEELLRNVFRK